MFFAQERLAIYFRFGIGSMQRRHWRALDAPAKLAAIDAMM